MTIDPKTVLSIKAEALREFVEARKDLLDCSGDTRWKSAALDRADNLEKDAEVGGPT